MKSSRIAFLVSLCCFLLAGCADQSPQGVAKEFCQALYSGQFKKAKSMCTPQTEEAVDLVASMMKKEDLETIKSGKIETYVVDYSIDEAEGTALVKVKVTLTPADSKETPEEVHDQKVNLEKVDGKWKVALRLK